MPLTFISKD